MKTVYLNGCTFLPINYSLLASNDDEKVLGLCNKIDRRTIAGKRRLMARQKATSVMVDLLKTALAAGHKAKYVLFDSWFSNPQQLLDIKKLGLNTIAMVIINLRLNPSALRAPPLSGEAVIPGLP